MVSITTRVNLFLFFFIYSLEVLPQVNIWENTCCKSKVELIPFLAEGSDNTAIIICPGGSYFWHSMQTEGYEVAHWLQMNGISAFVLRYRVGGYFAFFSHYRLLFKGHTYPAPQEDLHQAIAYLRQHAETYSISSERIGAMGFSAGAHLAMSGAELFKKNERPAFVAAIYPVVTMCNDYVHKRSRRGLLGERDKKNPKLCELLSLERHVPADCPPVFIVNCKDDPIVDYKHSVALDSALTVQGIPHKYIQYPTGGHGFGASDQKGSAECRKWKQAFLDWLNQL